MKRFSVRKIVLLAVFIAFSSVISYFESFIPFAFPGVKLGLANIFTIIVLYLYSPKEYLFVGGVRVLLVGLLRGSLINFAISVSGWCFASAATILFYHVKFNSIYGLSAIGASFHVLGQIIVVVIIYQIPNLVNYVPIVFTTSVASSVVVSLICATTLEKVGPYLLKEVNKDEKTL